MSTHPRRRPAPRPIILGALLALAVADPAGAGAAKPPSFVLEGGDRWFTHDVGWYPVVQGPATVVVGRQTVSGTLSATIQPDDHTMPAPGECESGISFVFVEGDRRAADVLLSSAGEICGHHLQPPTSVVTHTFTGTATIEHSGRPRIEGREAFLEIRMAQDRRASVFATSW